MVTYCRCGNLFIFATSLKEASPIYQSNTTWCSKQHFVWCILVVKTYAKTGFVLQDGGAPWKKEGRKSHRKEIPIERESRNTLESTATAQMQKSSFGIKIQIQGVAAFLYLWDFYCQEQFASAVWFSTDKPDFLKMYVLSASFLLSGSPKRQKQTTAATCLSVCLSLVF